MQRIFPCGSAHAAWSWAALQIVLGGIFVWAGLSKLIQGGEFSGTLYGRMVGGIPVVHYAFCTGEIALGLWILSGWRSDRAGSVAALVLLFFLGMIVFGLSRKTPEPCGCGLSRADRTPADIRKSLLISLGSSAVLFGLSCALAIRSPDGRTSASPPE